ncbi:hypothetical protein AB0M28_32465 [Streptomyces sp. NPDC051940]|uniref:hypothetical protein n=1 Tax=Streptomyces sp. NPDC051940 TaxID=3155675 RepID=UPI0034173790
MNAVKRIMIVAVAAGALITVGAVSPAGAADGAGQGLKVGDSVCTDWVQSDNGVRLTGALDDSTGEWTVRKADSPSGAETVVLRASAGSRTAGEVPIDRTVTAAGTEDFVYRACLSLDWVVKPIPLSLVANYRMALTSSSPRAVNDIGPHTAKLSAAQACGDRTAVQPGATVRLTGTSTGRTSWSINVTGNTNNYEGPWYALFETVEDIDATVTLDPEITEVTVCVGAGDADHRVPVAFELSVV